MPTVLTEYSVEYSNEDTHIYALRVDTKITECTYY